VLAVCEDGTPLCFLEQYQSEPHAYAKLWKHHACQKQTELIYEKAKDQDWLKRYGSQVSAEWLLPKVLEILQDKEELYHETDYYVEAGDWIVWQLTGQRKRSLCMAGYKAFWNQEHGYLSKKLYRSIDERLEFLAETKLSGEIIPTGSKAGTLTKEAAKKLGLAEGTVVAAAADGVVIQSGENGGYGISIYVDHGNGIITRYGHLSQAYAQVGRTVKQGETIGLSGNTGNSTGPHLHFEIRIGDVAVNPASYVEIEY